MWLLLCYYRHKALRNKLAAVVADVLPSVIAEWGEQDEDVVAMQMFLTRMGT